MKQPFTFGNEKGIDGLLGGRRKGKRKETAIEALYFMKYYKHNLIIGFPL